MLSQKVQAIESSPTLVLAAKAKELKAQGEDVISLSVGEPDWDTIEVAKSAGIQAIHDGDTKYLPAAGQPNLRKAIARQTSEDIGLDFDFKNVSVTPGAKFAIYVALQALIDPGDEVLIPNPYWVSYPAMSQLAGSTVCFAETTEEKGFKLTAELLRKSLTEKTKVLLLNSPSNPTGQVYSKEELGELAKVLKDFPRVVIISDDIYNRLVFSEGVSPHILHAAPELKDRCLLINGVSKSYSMTGWRVGWAVGPQELVAAMAKYQSQAVGAGCSISQAAALKAVESGEADLIVARKKLSERVNFACEALNALDGITCNMPGGAFYVWVNISSHLGKKFQGAKINTSKDFCEAFLKEKKVVTVPGADFGAEGYMRLSYALETDRMGEAIKRLSGFLEELS